MAEIESSYCPECEEAFDFPQPEVNRRDFLRTATATAVAVPMGVALGGLAVPQQAAAVAPTRPARPAEELIRELHSTLTAAQKNRVLLPYNHRANPKAGLTRQGMYNQAALGIRITDVYTKAQADLVERIVKSMCSGEDGYRQISRVGTWDASGSFDRCGALIFGDPTKQGEEGKYAFLFAGHHLTIRCDGNTEEGPAFGGPIYYGHTPRGYSRSNVFNYQTRSVQRVFTALDAQQRTKALVQRGNPGEQAGSVRFQADATRRPGIPYAELTADQKTLVQTVMRDVLSPYRKEDADEVMEIIRANGGMDRVQLAFYAEGGRDRDEPWSFWRLEGPGFVWNYRVLPHVHTYVNISSKLS